MSCCRCHQNDLENILPFFVLGLLYTLTNPSLISAQLLFGGFTAARIIHTIVFANAVPQPTRILVFSFGVTINFIMALLVLKHVIIL